MKVKLDLMEIELCKYIGISRSNMARKNNVMDAKIGNQNGIEADIQGFMAEYAFAKKFNLFPDFGLSIRSGSYDGITKKGYRYDIKSTKNKNGNLLSTLKINNDIDIYVLAFVENDTVEFVGWANKNELINENNIKDLGHGKGYFLSRNKLKKFT
ncbi:MAG: hypothetical protein EBR82_43415 [Caulobacteraceae bacterium]|nr:hypothetical protein [Caulobacteraceae bacterium]